MGTPEFAVASLDALVQAGCLIVGVVTAPDKPAGRGMKLNESAVKKYAVEKGLRLLQPEKLKNPLFLDELKSLKTDIQVVVAFRMLPELVWNMPAKGTINLHASLLPQYRGAAPINWAVINGEKETGVTTFKLKHDIDTGNILLQEKIAIGEAETAGELHDRMKDIGAALLVKTIAGIAQNSIQEITQHQLLQHTGAAGNEAAATDHIKHAPKIFTDTCKINWDNDVNDVFNLIRGLSPYPAAFTYLNEKMLKIFAADKEVIAHETGTGSYLTDHKTFLKFSCRGGYIHVKELQPEGKKKMQVADFLRGFRG